MRFYAYGCPECGEWSATVEGALTDACLQVLCPNCRNVERIYSQTVDRLIQEGSRGVVA